MKRPYLKFYLTILISLFPLFSLWAEEDRVVNWSSDQRSYSAQWGLFIPVIRRDMKSPAPAEEFIIGADFRELRLDSGIKYQYNQLDFTNRIIYMPTFFDTFQVGCGFTWHFYRYFKEFTENDFIFNMRFRLINGPVFSLENAAGFLFKFASIDAIREINPYIFNFSYNFDFTCNWHFLHKNDIWFGLKLQDYFDYPLAISPFLKLGYNYTATPGVIFGVDYCLKFIDMFFSAVYINESILRFTFKVKI